MIVREVHLENVKSYGSPAEVVKLTKGVNAISGQNGAGKSTVLEAIGCALFQHLPYRQEDFVREGQVTGTITVVVESRLDEKTYEIVRRIGKNSAHYVFDPDLKQQIARGEADIGRWLRQHLQVSPEIDLKTLFLDSVGPPQGTLTATFLDSPQVRRVKFNRLLKVEEYEDAYRKLAALESAIDGEHKELDVRIARLEGEAAVRPDLETRRAAKRDEQAGLARQLSRYLAERDVLDHALAMFDEASVTWRNADNKLELAVERERHASSLRERAQAEHAAARAAAETFERTKADRDRYVTVEADLRQLDLQRHERDRWRELAGQIALKVKNEEGEIGRLDDEIARCDRAREAILELTPLIPLQEAAEERLQRARAAKQRVDDVRRNVDGLRDQMTKLAARGTKAKRELEAVEALRPLAEEVPARRANHDELAERLAEINRAEGQLQSVRGTLDAERHRVAALRQRVALLDEAIAGAVVSETSTEDLSSLEDRFRVIGEKRATAHSHLSHARQTRVQVAGGLCPFLHEACQNLRPGVTLEGHFDGEIVRWGGEVEQLTSAFAEADGQIKEARLIEQRRTQAGQWRAERQTVVRDLDEIERVRGELGATMQALAQIVQGRARTVRDEQVARQALRDAERAAQEVSHLDSLRQQLQEAREDYQRLRQELQAAEDQLGGAAAVEAELQAATVAYENLGRPREAIGHHRRDADRLASLHQRHQQLVEDLERVRAELRRAEDEVARFADVDRRYVETGQRRDELRPRFEACLSAQPLAETLGARSATLLEMTSLAEAAAADCAQARAAAEAAEAGYDQDAHASAQTERARLATSIGETQAWILAAAEEEERLTAQLAGIRKIELDLADLRAEAERLDSERSVASALRQAIRATGPEVTRQILAGISRMATRINGEILNQAGVELEWTTDFEIVTRRQGEARGFAQLSGGEQMAAALAVRMAVLRQLSKVRLAFLDEPTAHLDQARRSNLGDQVQRLQGFDQLVVISHDDTFDGLFGHVVRIGRENGQSHVLEHE